MRSAQQGLNSHHGGTNVRKRYRLLGALVALGLTAAACGSDDDTGSSDTSTSDTATAETGGGSETTAGEAGEGAEITIALGSEPTSLDPHIVDDGGERAINDNIYETLLTRDADGELEPGLATALPTQVDDTTWEFTLREGVTFHDGSPFNADSVVASVNRMVKLVADGEDRQRRLLLEHHRGDEGRRLPPSRSRPPDPTACCRRACTG